MTEQMRVPHNKAGISACAYEFTVSEQVMRGC